MLARHRHRPRSIRHHSGHSRGAIRRQAGGDAASVMAHGTEVHVRIKVFIQQEEFHNDANKFHREQRPVVGHKGHRSIGKDDR